MTAAASPVAPTSTASPRQRARKDVDYVADTHPDAATTKPSSIDAPTSQQQPQRRPPAPTWRLLAPTLIENLLLIAAFHVRCLVAPPSPGGSGSAPAESASTAAPDAPTTPDPAPPLADSPLSCQFKLGSATTCHFVAIPAWVHLALTFLVVLDLILDRRRILGRASTPLERATRHFASPGLVYGMGMLPAVLSRSGLRVPPPCAESRSPCTFVAPALTPWTLIALGAASTPALLYAFPRAFSVGEALTLGTALTLVADSLRARPVHAHMVVAVMQHLALGTAVAVAASARTAKQMRALCGADGCPPTDDEGTKQWRGLVRRLYLTVGGVVALVATPLVTVRTGRDPWIWVAGYVLGSLENSIACAFWLALLGTTYLVFPHKASANTQRKVYHLLAVLIILPGYLYTPVFTCLALCVALAAFIFAELFRLARAPPVGRLLDLGMAAFRDDRDEAPLLTSHIYLLLGTAVPVWVAVIEGTWLPGLAGLAALGAGDAAASVVGRAFGATRWHQRTNKTVEGSVAFVVATLALLAALGEPVTGQVLAGVVLTAVVEGVSGMFDNFAVPLVMLLTLM
ncbi:hypothetical protein AMAG_19185 [Allomyces macrogynus ATCC 38327]|uniref:dolichol kinase n=1 Tax=Allomyces macrogynus (strain ATCC 38327) TaxID=578462 RepID=A0A0L0SSX2_ALLM3|nr:hypothetical protein AMAG_19185 [Allomyces macrogynus ATCC 38327]|eukprot:KNE65591.1 hypothetical protein AMAG_19185 [Allomyces macrogynus ATCC 38327]